MRNHRTRRRAALLSTALLAPAIAVTALAPGASALNVVAVTTTSDVVDGGDGLTSLREAFTIANTDGDDTQITLPADTLHRLCDVVATATDEDANADGDLDHTAADALVVLGNGSEIRNGCAGERVLHHVSSEGSIELQDLLVTGGDVSLGAPGSGLLALNDVVIDGSTFSDNTGGPAVEVGDPGGGAPYPVATVSDSTFSDNRGGIRVNRAVLHASTSEFEFNQGPAVSASFGTANVTGSLVRENASGITGIDAAISVADSVVRDNAGIGIRNTGNAPTGYPLTVTNTEVLSNGTGGVSCSYCTSLTITDSTIADNHPGGGTDDFPDFGGSGVLLVQNLDGPTATITRTTISGNTATEHGGGVLVQATDVVADVTITDSTITGNRTGLFGDGGGIHATSTDLTITGSHVDGNFAKPVGILVGGSGGGISQRDGGSLTVSDSTIDGNLADDGGGGVSLFDVGTASFTRSSLSGNTAEGFGGGAFTAAGDGTAYSFVDTTVDGNSAQLAGGGIEVVNDTAGVAVLIERSTLSGNTTDLNGGGLFTNTATAAVTVRNSTVTGNSAASTGGGIAVLITGTVDLEHATIVDNSAPVAANLYHQTGTLTSFGSVIALPHGGGEDCGTFSGATVSEGANFSGADTCGFGAGPDDEEAGGDPLLAPLADLGGPTDARAPLPGSPLSGVIAAVDCLLAVDQVGASRPQGAGCDIGAVEVTGGIAAIDDIVSIPKGKKHWTIIHPLLNDHDPDQRLKWSSLRIIDEPDHGKAVVIRHGRIKYVADKKFVGTDTLTYRVCTRPSKHHPKQCFTAVVTIQVG